MCDFDWEGGRGVGGGVRWQRGYWRLCMVAIGDKKKDRKKLIKSLVNKLVHCHPIHLLLKNN